MEENKNILRLSVKKDIYSDVIDNNVRSVNFEIKPYWMSRFTGNSKSDIDDVKSGKIPFKLYDEVLLTCNDLSALFEFESIEIVNDEFVVRFTGFFPEDDETDENEDNYYLELVEPLEPLEDEGESESKDEPTPEPEPQPEIEEIHDVADDKPEQTVEISKYDEISHILDKLYSGKNVYVVNAPVVHICSNGQMLGYSKMVPITNDTGLKFNLDNEVIKFRDLDELENKLDEILKNRIVFIWKSQTKINVNHPISTVNLIITKLNKTIY